ncbi:MAG: hypothetical protein RLZZ253_1764 [Verrucomicrobiota bacterium]
MDRQPRTRLDPMTTTELKAALIAEGCNENTFAIGNRGTASDTFCLIHQNGRWEVFYTERGSDDPPIYTGTSEHDACVFFKHHILSQRHWHMVGFFCSESEAIALEERIRALGVQPVRNDIPAFQQPGDARYRVFVMGKDIFPIRQAIAGVPIRRD